MSIWFNKITKEILLGRGWRGSVVECLEYWGSVLKTQNIAKTVVDFKNFICVIDIPFTFNHGFKI